jgi:hypothetical protein
VAVDRALWWSVWWQSIVLSAVVVLAVVTGVVLLAVTWRAHRRTVRRRKVSGVPLYLDEVAIMDLYRAIGLGDAAVRAVIRRIMRRGQVQVPVIGGAGAGGEHESEVTETYTLADSAISVVDRLMEALRASGNLVRVDLGGRTAERSPAVEPDATTARLGDLDAFVLLKGTFRHEGGENGSMVFVAPVDKLPDGPRVRIECRAADIQRDVPGGWFNGRCLGRVLSWEDGEWAVYPIAVFQ